MGVLGAAALVIVAVMWKEFKLLSFDPEFAASLGMPVRRLDGLLTGLLVVAIVIGLQTVGVVLMSAMIVAPAAAARLCGARGWSVTINYAGNDAAAEATAEPRRALGETAQGRPGGSFRPRKADAPFCCVQSSRRMPTTRSCCPDAPPAR